MAEPSPTNRERSGSERQLAALDLGSNSFHLLVAQETNGRIQVVDRIKDIGFEYATRSGATIAISDLVIPGEKATIIAETEEVVAEVDRQYRRGLLTEEEARQHPYRNIILRSVGSKPEVEPEFFSLQLQLGDSVLLCTDGLTDVVRDEELLQAIERHGPQKTVEALTALANRRGGPDNSTAILLRAASPAMAVAVTR